MITRIKASWSLLENEALLSFWVPLEVFLVPYGELRLPEDRQGLFRDPQMHWIPLANISLSCEVFTKKIVLRDCSNWAFPFSETFENP